MANEEQLSILKQGVEIWNEWRTKNIDAHVDLSGADLRGADLRGAHFSNDHLLKPGLRSPDYVIVDLSRADLSKADLSRAELGRAFLWQANLRGATLCGADLHEADLREADLSGADLREVHLMHANLRKAGLWEANLDGADLWYADLSEAFLHKAYFRGANLCGSNLTGTYLSEAFLLDTKIENAKVSGSYIYGINVWDLEGEFEEQKDLVITPSWDLGKPIITVDNIKIAQFIYLILNNEEIRDVINTLTSKSVLILGRFALAERKAILEALRNKLREYNLLPIVFDFARPTDKDFTETIKTLAGLSYFVIADITNPKSSPLELQATVPDYQIPFVPIIHEGEQPFAMMVDLQKKYNWVLDTLSYSSIETLIKALKPAIIDPAIQKHNELRLIKAREPKIRSANDFIEDRGLDN